jgi:hypothetical protein
VRQKIVNSMDPSARNRTNPGPSSDIPPNTHERMGKKKLDKKYKNSKKRGGGALGADSTKGGRGPGPFCADSTS